jgi:hypothetical protein
LSIRPRDLGGVVTRPAGFRLAAQLIGDFPDSDDIDPELLEWIVRK